MAAFSHTFSVAPSAETTAWSDQTKLGVQNGTRTEAENVIKILQMSDSWGANLWPNFEILTVLGLCSHIFTPINVKFGTGGTFYVYRVNVSPLRGE